MKKRDSELTILEWLGFKRKISLADIRVIGPVIGVFIILVLLILFAAIVIILIDFVQAGLRVGPYTADDDGSAIRNIGLALVTLVGAPFVIWRSIVADRQVKIADKVLFNNKINSISQNLRARREVTRSVQQNGNDVILTEINDDLVTRATALDELEGLVEENKKLAPRIARLIATYIRGNFPATNLDPTENLAIRPTPRMDLQRAIDALGRINSIAVKIDTSQWRLDLANCNFDGVNFSQGFFRAANFSQSRFEAAICNNANFEGALFYGSLLNHGNFFETNFKGAKLERIILNRPSPVPGGFVSSINMGDLEGVSFVAADISALDYIGTAGEISELFATSDTIISERLRRDMLPIEEHRRAVSLRDYAKRNELTIEQADLVQRLEETGFNHWSPHPASDGATGFLKEKFYKELKMDKWPYYP